MIAEHRKNPIGQASASKIGRAMFAHDRPFSHFEDDTPTYAERAAATVIVAVKRSALAVMRRKLRVSLVSKAMLRPSISAFIPPLALQIAMMKLTTKAQPKSSGFSRISR